MKRVSRSTKLLHRKHKGVIKYIYMPIHWLPSNWAFAVWPSERYSLGKPQWNSSCRSALNPTWGDLQTHANHYNTVYLCVYLVCCEDTEIHASFCRKIKGSSFCLAWNGRIKVTPLLKTSWSVEVFINVCFAALQILL